MKKLLAAAFAFVLGCSSADGVNFDRPTPEVDAGGGDALVPPTPTSTGTGEPPPPPKVDSGAGGGGAADTGSTPDAGALPEAAVDVVVTPEAATDAGAPDAIDSGVDARPDSAPTVDANDAATDAGSDGATSDGGNATDAPADSGLAPICPDTSVPKCQAANDTDAVIQATFPQACTPEGLRKCGGVFRGVVETLPMNCLMGRWRLAGYWSGVQWVPSYECSKGCGAAGKLCDP